MKRPICAANALIFSSMDTKRQEFGLEAERFARFLLHESGGDARKARGPKFKELEDLYAYAGRQGWRFLLPTEIDDCLASLEPPLRPFGVWAHGDTEIFVKKKNSFIAIVGSRRATAYGLAAARHWAMALAEAGACIVSGLAYGIDTVAHCSAVEAGGSTIAVLGNGLGTAYPASNIRLQRELIPACGAVISEFPLQTKPMPENFPYRNRLIAALAGAVIVVEADLASGSLITARWAAQLGKEVFAVPGSIFSKMSRGSNLLLQQGAGLLLDMQDLAGSVTGLKIFTEKSCARDGIKKNRHGPHGALLKYLSKETPSTLDELLAKSTMPLAGLTQALLELQTQGVICQLAQGGYVLAC